MKKLLTIASLCMAIFTTQAYAQTEGNTPEERAAMQTEVMKSKLSLDNDQQTKMAAINLKYAKQFERLKSDGDSRISKFRKAKEISDAKDKEVKPILTNDQYKQYEKMKEEMKNRMRENMSK